jgi:hypothetical protein
LGVYAPMNGAAVVGASAFDPDEGGSVTVNLLGTGGAQCRWNGFNAQGQKVASGAYTVSLVEASTTGGLPAQYSVGVTVLRSVVGGVAIYNTAGELVRHFTSAVTELPFLALSARSFVAAPGTAGLKIAWGEGGQESVSWDGRNDAGTFVAAGTYEIRVSQGVGDQNLVKTGFVQVLETPASLLDGAEAAPNPVVGANLSVVLPGLGASDMVWGGVYSLAGAKVAQASALGSPLVFSVADLADGIYLVTLEARSAGDGAAERKMLKIAVTH